MHNKDTEKTAQDLRKSGNSYLAISKKLNIAKSTAYLWTKNIKISASQLKNLTINSKKGLKRAQQSLLIKKLKTAKLRSIDAQKILSSLNFKDKNLLQTVAAIIFWCEGGKRSLSKTTLTNSDPKLIKTFLYCLRNGFQIEEKRFRALMHLHNYHDEDQQRLFWSKTTGIPTAQFNKTYFKKTNKSRIRENYQGCIAINYNSAEVARKLDAIYHAIGKLRAIVQR
ncbi:hypothetical protein IT413_05890 [Candidatus Peregrinibacteria bacterium]|nr:hypothetical protein [Candidatus Peregrinibacteria bacterium]